MLLTVGGANTGFELKDREDSNRFPSDVKGIIDDDFGGLDGLDWNNSEGSVSPSTSEMIYVSQSLKQTYGSNFLITMPPAPWRQADKDAAEAMSEAGALDYAGPQFYDGPGLTDLDNIKNHLSAWTDLLGQEKVVVGLGVRDGETNYMTGSEVKAAMGDTLNTYPNVRGVYQWETHCDSTTGNDAFADEVDPVVCPYN